MAEVPTDGRPHRLTRHVISIWKSGKVVSGREGGGLRSPSVTKFSMRRPAHEA